MNRRGASKRPSQKDPIFHSESARALAVVQPHASLFATVKGVHYTAAVLCRRNHMLRRNP